jgi:MFS family permease
MFLHVPPALRHRRFFVYWSGYLLSAAGSQMQFWTILWHIRTLTDQPIALGAVGAARVVPIVIFSLIAGTIADSFDRRVIIFITQSARLLIALALGLLTWSGEIALWHIYLLTVLQAIVISFDVPARGAIVPNLVPPEDLSNAFSINSIAGTVGAIAGPAVSGMIIGYLGLEWVYFTNTFTYLGIIVALIAIGPIAQQIAARKSKSWIDLTSIREGISYIRTQPIIFSSMILDFFATFFSSANALLPIFAVDILGVDEIGYGWLSAAQSVGAATAAATLSQFNQIRRQGVILLGAVVSYGAWTVVFGTSRWYWVSFLALAMMGASDTVSMVIRNTVRQLLTPDYIRGRMTSINQIFFMGGPQLGEVEAGLVAQFFGPVLAVVTGGIGTILAVGWIARRWPQLPKYRGDLEEIEALVQA